MAFGQAPPAIQYTMMTNGATDNKVAEDFAQNGHFGLGSANVDRVVQPNVPVFDRNGRWLRIGRYQLSTKPHGHGDLWPLLFNPENTEGAELPADFRLFTLAPQGNNPFVFGHALTFAGLGILREAAFGFATCPREVGAPEGLVAAVQHPDGSYGTINAEYAIMDAYGIEDTADSTGYSPWPGNLNFLFARNAAIAPLIARNRFPGELTNPTKPQYSFAEGREVPGGRRESQMQGVAVELSAPAPDSLPVFVFNAPRNGDPKGHFAPFKNSAGKPRDTVATSRAFYSNMCAARLEAADIEIKGQRGESEPGVPILSQSVFELTPAFGDAELIPGKVGGGQVGEGSTLFLSGFHSEVRNLTLDGDLEIVVENEVGDMQAARAANEAIIPNPAKAGKYQINSLTVKNEGRKKVIDEETSKWEGEFENNGHCRIVIEGNGELVVKEGTVIEGDFDLTVKDGEKITLSAGSGNRPRVNRETITQPSWSYTVKVNEEADNPVLFELEKTA
ncbi:hypothetical protein ACFL5U_01395 [Candidatus Margulisiibacteriota bacterium]